MRAWMIRRIAPLSDGETLYWANDFGWVDRSIADVFSDHERSRLNLPVGGEWEEIPLLAAWQPHESPGRTEYVARLERVATAARDWIEHLERKGGHYRDGVPGELMDTLDALDSFNLSHQTTKDTP